MNARRLLCSTLTTILGVLVFASAPALAAAPEAPVTGPVSGVTATSATLGGTLNPGASAKAGWYFFYSTEISCLVGQAATGQEPEVEGQALAEHVEVTGLQPSMTYRVCMVATNEAGEATPSANEVSFTTPAAPPAVEGESVSGVTTSEAHLEATVNANNQEVTKCEFQYGTEASLATSTTVGCEPATLAGVYGGQGVGVSVPVLHADKTYYYRVIAENAAHEKTEGTIEHFITAPETPEGLNAEPIGSTTATLNGVLDPKATIPGEAGTYEFLWRSAMTCEGGESSGGSSAGGVAEAVKAELTGLLPGSTYTFCLRARNEAGAEALSAPVKFATVAIAPVIVAERESVTEVTAISAKLHAEIDPGAQETTYHFEYGTSSAYGQSTPTSAPIGSDSESPATAAIQGLQPGTTYHYHVLATNSQSPAGGTPGPDQTFTTETKGEEFALPDSRAYELVSPPQKDGAEVLGIGGEAHTLGSGGTTQASEDGTSVTYIATAPVGANPPGNLFSTLMFSTRDAGGWSSKDISLSHVHSIKGNEVGGGGQEYLRFSPDLSRAVLVPLKQTFEPSLAPEVHQEVAYGQELYLRDNVTGSFQAMVTNEPLPTPGSGLGLGEGNPVVFEGATPGLDHVVFEGPVGLDPHYPHGGSLYEWSNGQAQLVDVLPKPTSEPAGSGSQLGGVVYDSFGRVDEGFAVMERHAISDDGTRVVWSNGEGSLFARDMVTGETLQVDAVQSGGGLAGGGAFKVANSDGSRVFLTDGKDLVSGAHEGDLYMFEPARPEGERLTDLTLGVAGADLGQVNFLEANETGTSIYVTTPGVLTSAPNSQGKSATPCPPEEEGEYGELFVRSCNLYLLREFPAGSGSWGVTFIAGGVAQGLGEQNAESAPFVKQTARVSPNGGFLAFMSRESLTGYDSRDANSGQPDEEVYLYDAEANKLVCASCDPTGARPVGEFSGSVTLGGFTDFVAGTVPMDPWGMWHEHWLAASIPGWTPDGYDNTTGYQPRYLNDSGRLFFDSVDALVPRDVNGREDVYEYEPVGVGSCRPPSYGQGASVVFNRTLSGCIALISAGTGNSDSVFVDASASGNDVFFATQDGLVQNDRDGAADMYDARVCTQTAPCPSSLAVSPACTTTDSCRVAPSPQPGVFAAPATATFVGAGNVTPTLSATKKAATKKTVKCAKGKKRSRGRCVKAKKMKTRAKKARNDRRLGR